MADYSSALSKKMNVADRRSDGLPAENTGFIVVYGAMSVSGFLMGLLAGFLIWGLK